MIHQGRQRTINLKHLYSRVPSLRPLLPFRTSNTTTNSSDTLGNSWTRTVPLGPPTSCPDLSGFMCYLRTARNTILLRVSADLQRTVESASMAGFTISGRLTDTNRVTKPNWCSLQHSPARASQSSFPNSASGGLQPERLIGL